MNKPKLIYLSTAYTFDKEKGAANAVDFLVACLTNYEPEKFLFFSPITHTEKAGPRVSDKGYNDFWHRIDNHWIERCDEVWVLLDSDGGWRNSEGMVGEVAHARSKNIPVHFFVVGEQGGALQLERVECPETYAPPPPPPLPSLDDPCPHPARNGIHELYVSGDGKSQFCRACGARGPFPDV